jgi:hypothetical protein
MDEVEKPCNSEILTLCCRNNFKRMKITSHNEQSSADVALSNADFEEALGIYLVRIISCCFTKEPIQQTHHVCICIYTLNILRLTMNWKGYGRKWSLPSLQYHPSILLGDLRKTVRNFSQDLNLGPPEYVAGVLATHLQHLIMVGAKLVLN